MLNLRAAENRELQREDGAKLAGKKFKPAIEPPYRWRDWAAKSDGITGDELLAFINNEEAALPQGAINGKAERGPGLFRYLRSLTSSDTASAASTARDTVATVFKGVDITCHPRPRLQRRIMNPQDITLCLRPRKLKVRDVRRLLMQKDDTAKEYLADLILHRLRDRYVTPLENVAKEPVDYRSGFLVMAAASLMIETFQCFKEGEPDTLGRGKGMAMFKRFFVENAVNFPGVDGEEFYDKVRCGILHQAQTKGRIRIRRKGKIYDSAEQSINASLFLGALKIIVEDYVSDLRVQAINAGNWPNALLKIGYICETIEND